MELLWTSKLAWRWVVEEALSESNRQNLNVNTGIAINAVGPLNSKSLRDCRTKFTPALVRFELRNESSHVSKYCDAPWLYPLEDKAELAQTIRTCGCAWAIPETKAFENATEAWFDGVVNNHAIADHKTSMFKTMVLKPTKGCCGHGIAFVSSLPEAADIVQRQPQATESIATEWILQQHIVCSSLASNHKFHVRFYVLCLGDEEPEILLYTKDYEVRVAAEDMAQSTDNLRAHITNGAGSDSTDRLLMRHIPEMLVEGIPEVVASFAKSFLKELFTSPQYMSCLAPHLHPTAASEGTSQTSSFCIAGVDIMIDGTGTPFLLEVNGNPAAPPRQYISLEFQQHLIDFMSAVVNKVLFDKQDDDAFLVVQ